MTIWDNPKLKTTKVPLILLMVEQIAHGYQGTLLINKNVTTWVDIKGIAQSEKNQSQKQVLHCMISLI